MPFADDFKEIVKLDEPLAPLTWFRLGGPAQYLAAPRSREELAALVKRAREEELPVRLLGGGSNVLISDAGLPGLTIQLTDPCFNQIQVSGGLLTAGGGAKLGHVVSTSVREGLAGMETLVGIPGTVGGALHGNSGGRGGDIGQWTCEALVMTHAGEIIHRKRKELVFAYRASSLDELVILEGKFQLEKDDPTELVKRMQKLWIVKKSTQPLSHQNAGCIFKNPRGMSAGMLIDQAGFKGLRVGGAEVSDRHANFIITHPGATSRDVQELITQIQEQIAERLGVTLELEIAIW